MTRTFPVSAAAILVALVLGGCASGETGATAGATLADAKALVQLVRIETEERLPADDLIDVETVADNSESCRPESEDPDGLERRWVTSARFNLVATDSTGLGATFQAIIDSFTANGWSEVEYGGAGVVTLSRPGSDADISFVASLGAEGTPSNITADIHSGCVTTEGADSDEVTQLDDLAG